MVQASARLETYVRVEARTSDGARTRAATAGRLLIGGFVILIGSARPSTAAEATAVAVGDNHSCALTATGDVWCWGSARSFQLGNGGENHRAAGGPIEGLERPALAIAAGGDRTCAINARGVQCWGSGYLGTASPSGGPRALWVDGLPGRTTAITLGRGHTCSLDEAGDVFCWGENTAGQIGDASTGSRARPERVLGLREPAVAISAGDEHTCALSRSGTVTCWGANDAGQLGDGTLTSRVIGGASVPLTNVVAISAGGRHSCARLSDGTAACWGSNEFGELADGTTASRPVPHPISLAGGVDSIVARNTQTCVLTLASAVECWGTFNESWAPPRSIQPNTAPVIVEGLEAGVVSIAVGPAHGCAVLQRRAVRCWGRRELGQLGDGEATWRYVPGPVATLTGGAVAVDVGRGHACAVMADGTVRCWGDNRHGQLGDGTGTNRLLPAPVFAPGIRFASVALGGMHTCGATADGEVWCWGDNTYGQLGDGTTLPQRLPVRLQPLDAPVVRLSAGYSATCAITTRGTLWCWGGSHAGYLPSGPRPAGERPAQVLGFDDAVTDVSVGGAACAVTRSGAAFCWGWNEEGQLGDGTRTSRTNPGVVTGLGTGVLSVGVGLWHACASLVAGGVKCWGAPTDQAFFASDWPTLVPVDLPAFTGVVRRLTADWAHACGIADGGRAVCWGRAQGGLFLNQVRAAGSPTVVPGLGSGVISLATAYERTCAVTAAGAVLCSGDNGVGQLGDGSVSADASTRAVDVAGFGANRLAYFAEGATSATFTTEFVALNPSNEGVNAWLDFQPDHGFAHGQGFRVPPHTRFTLDVGEVPEMRSNVFSTTGQWTGPLVVNRVMTWTDSKGRVKGTHVDEGARAPGSWWALAEGATHSGFELFYLIHNPSPTSSARVQIRYLLPAPRRPIGREYVVAPASRLTIWVNEEDPALASTDVSAEVASVNAIPIVVERAMYRSRDGVDFDAGHVSTGIETGGLTWHFAEGATGTLFDMFLLIANPETTDATVHARYVTANGTVVTKDYLVPAASRVTVWVDHEDPALDATSVATSLTSDNVPFVAERTMWWPGAPETWREAHNATASSEGCAAWAIADGDASTGADSYLLVYNTAAAPRQASLTLYRDDGATESRSVAVPSDRRSTIDVGSAFPSMRGHRFGVVVEEIDDGGSTPSLVVEGSVYADVDGVRWAVGRSTRATCVR